MFRPFLHSQIQDAVLRFGRKLGLSPIGAPEMNNGIAALRVSKLGNRKVGRVWSQGEETTNKVIGLEQEKENGKTYSGNTLITLPPSACDRHRRLDLRPL